MDFVVPADHRVKTKDNKKIDKYFDFARELKISNCKTWGWWYYLCCVWKGSRGLVKKKKNEGIGNQRKNRNYPDYTILKIDYNSQRSPGELGRLAVTQIPTKNYQLNLFEKVAKTFIMKSVLNERTEIKSNNHTME